MKQVMNAPTQYKPSAAELDVMLALMRGGSLAEASTRLGVDASTVFRTLQRIEKGLGRTLFERSRQGYRPTETALRIAPHAERIEAELEAVRGVLQEDAGAVSGTVRITTTETVLATLVLPALRDLGERHPLLQYELSASNELANLTRRDADIAVRATRRPPEHLVGRALGPIRIGLYAAADGPWRDADPALCPWIAPDDALPEHPSVLWRRRRYPRIVPRFRVNSLQAVSDAVALGLGVGVLPLFCGDTRPGLLRRGEPLAEAETMLWLLAHPESRHLRRVAVVYGQLAEHIRL